MRRNPFKKGIITSVFITILLITTLKPSFLPIVAALENASTPTIIINPQKGRIGDVIRVVGEIDTTNGSYLIFFDDEIVKEGTATGTAVNDTLIIPPRPMGNYSVTLHDVKSGYTSSELFTIQTAYFVKAVVPSPPKQLQEGDSTKILVNVTGGAENTRYLANITVTDPSGRVFYNDTLQLTNTTKRGYGKGNITYPADFSIGAHTNYTGTYRIGFNETLATANFTVGLTDKREYRRMDNVHIRGTGYKADEKVTVNITTAGETVTGHPRNITARADGFVIHKWEIPDNSTLGTYTVSLSNAAPEGTAKPVPDAQNFTIIFIQLNESIPILEPPSGRWEAQVRLVGEIETFGGNYSILWDGKSIREGTCAPNSGVVNDTFPVPISVKGHHNITLYDNTTETSSLPSVFEVTTSCHVSVSRDRIQEGDNTTITVGVDEAKANATYLFLVTVTDPAGRSHSIGRAVIIDSTFSGENSTTYWADFTDATTDYMGTYNITAKIADKKRATGHFNVSLTDKPQYVRRYLSEGKERTSEVAIQGSGYNNETVTINITYYNDTSLIPVEGYPKTENASDGVVIHKWRIPDNATLATYNVTLKSTNVDKPIKDTQNFDVIEIVVSCQAQNKYDNKSLPGVSVEAYFGVIGFLFVGSQMTNGTGWVDFLVDEGYYSFGTYWREVQIGATNGSVTRDGAEYALRIRFYVKCELARITMMARDNDGPLPFIEVTLKNVTLAPEKIPPLQTGYTGLISTNAFTNTMYRIEARRYGYLFFNGSIGNLTKTIGNITDPYPITCPTYTLFISALDSEEQPIENAPVEVIEWSSGRIAGEGKTSQWGSVRLNCTFGRYKARVYNAGKKIILNETVVDVVRNQIYLVLRCGTVNLDLSVRVIDYLGQPIPNAVVKIERENLEAFNLTTGPDGIASQHEILGGDYRVPAQFSLYVAGRLCGVKSFYLDESKEITFKVSDYVMVGGYPLESNQLITGTSLTILLVFCALALVYRRRSKKS